jgi:hypothetical protein
MKYWLGLGLFLFFFISLSGQGLPALGNWRDHLPLRKVLAVGTHSGKVEVATAFGLFGYDPASKEFSRMSKSSGLAEVKIRTMSSSPINTQQLVVYENSNLDLIDGDLTRIDQLDDLSDSQCLVLGLKAYETLSLKHTV